MSILRTAVQYGATNHNLINVEIDTAYDFGDGNHTIEVSGDKTDIKTGNGNSNIKSYGNEANVTTGNGNNKIVSYGSDASITTGSGNQKITSIGDNKTIVTDGGDDDITFIGDGCTLEAGDGNNKVIFWGNNTDIKTGNGDDDIKTFDQVYDEEDYSDLAQAFIATLPTGVWEDWNRIARHQIDYICQKSLMSKSQTWVYEDTYDVYTIFSRYINGLKNVNIDMGGGENTASLTVDKASSNIVDNGKKVNLSNSNIKFNEDDSLDTVLDKRNETKLDVKTKSNTRWGGVFVAAAAAVAAVAATVCTGGLGAVAGTWLASAIGTTAAQVVTVAGAAMAGYGIANSGYNIATGQAHTSDYINLATSIAGLGAATGLTNAAVLTSAEGMNLSTATANCVSTYANAFNTIAYGSGVIDNAAKIAQGDGDFLTVLSLVGNGLGAVSSGMQWANSNYSIMDDITDAASWVNEKIGDGINYVGSTASDAFDKICDTVTSPFLSDSTEALNGLNRATKDLATATKEANELATQATQLAKTSKDASEVARAAKEAAAAAEKVKKLTEVAEQANKLAAGFTTGTNAVTGDALTKLTAATKAGTEAITNATTTVTSVSKVATNVSTTAAQLADAANKAIQLNQVSNVAQALQDISLITPRSYWRI